MALEDLGDNLAIGEWLTWLELQHNSIILARCGHVELHLRQTNPECLLEPSVVGFDEVAQVLDQSPYSGKVGDGRCKHDDVGRGVTEGFLTTICRVHLHAQSEESDSREGKVAFICQAGLGETREILLGRARDTFSWHSRIQSISSGVLTFRFTLRLVGNHSEEKVSKSK
jgi:hypothetical protein